MKLEKFKEKDHKRIGIIVFTIVCILLVSGVILYQTFAIFEVKTNQNVIHGSVQEMGDLRFMVYVEGELQKDMPNQNSEYSLDTSKSYCEDITDPSKRSPISWNQEKWSIEIKDIGTTKTKCYLYFDKLYVDSTLNGAIPDLGNELVAITFDANGHALKADLTKDWYDYSKQEWANAVILRRKNEYEVGEEIPEENIESYFVWIPRYEYQLWNGVKETNQFTEVKVIEKVEDVTKNEQLNQTKKIEIRFVNKNEPVKIGSNKGDYITHPAFTSFDSNGFWVGKFETGYNQDKEGEETISPDNIWTTSGAQKDIIDSKKLIIKPNVYSWRNIKVANAFYTVYNYKRELDSHMMKNMEWGAVAYLTNSKYGRCLDETCTEVRINNSNSYVTGSSAVKDPTCGYTKTNEICNQYGTSAEIVNNYNNPLSNASSTTNNYYGIYDMSGGAHEYVMGVILDQNNSPSSGRNDKYNSNFIGTLTYPTDGTVSSKTTWTKEDGGYPWPDSKYYNTYAYAETDQAFNRGFFGDGTKELGLFYKANFITGSINRQRQVSEWNADDAYFISQGSPWFARGGRFSDGTSTGIFNFYAHYGSNMNDFSFRVVLIPY